MRFTPLQYPVEFTPGENKIGSLIGWCMCAGLNLTIWFYTIKLLTHAVKLGLQQ